MDITIKIADENIAEALRLAHIKGVAYWCDRIATSKGGLLINPQSFTERKRVQYWPVFEGKWTLRDAISHTLLPLTDQSLARGVQVIIYDYPTTFSELISGDVTENTGDTLVQCSVFGKVTYSPTIDIHGRIKAAHVCPTCRVPHPCKCITREEATRRPTMRP